jgi:hypothetical protein
MGNLLTYSAARKREAANGGGPEGQALQPDGGGQTKSFPLVVAAGFLRARSDAVDMISITSATDNRTEFQGAAVQAHPSHLASLSPQIASI